MHENSNLKAHVVHGIMIYHVCVQAHETWHGNMNRALGLKPSGDESELDSRAPPLLWAQLHLLWHPVHDSGEGDLHRWTHAKFESLREQLD